MRQEEVNDAWESNTKYKGEEEIVHNIAYIQAKFEIRLWLCRVCAKYSIYPCRVEDQALAVHGLCNRVVPSEGITIRYSEHKNSNLIRI